MSDSLVILIKQLINGIQLGSVYALVSLGYTMVYGIIKLINFAHGDFIMVGGYIIVFSILFLTSMGISIWLSVIPAVILCLLNALPINRSEMPAPYHHLSQLLP